MTGKVTAFSQGRLGINYTHRKGGCELPQNNTSPMQAFSYTFQSPMHRPKPYTSLPLVWLCPQLKLSYVHLCPNFHPSIEIISISYEHGHVKSTNLEARRHVQVNIRDAKKKYFQKTVHKNVYVSAHPVNKNN